MMERIEVQCFAFDTDDLGRCRDAKNRAVIRIATGLIEPKKRTVLCGNDGAERCLTADWLVRKSDDFFKGAAVRRHSKNGATPWCSAERQRAVDKPIEAFDHALGECVARGKRVDCLKSTAVVVAAEDRVRDVAQRAAPGW